MATRINLLPWRESLRKERQRQFGSVAVGAAALMAAAVFYVHMHINGMIEYQESRNAFLDTEIAALDKKIAEIKELEKKKKQLLGRMNVIQDLQARRPLVVRMVDGLVRTVPEGVFLSSVSQKDKVLSLNGDAQSNARVSSFMRALDASPWFENPKLTVIQASGGSNVGRSSKFSLVVSQVLPAGLEKAAEPVKGKKKSK